jgi:hypothetical protein
MATITSDQTGDWDQTSTWVGGVVPQAGDDVVIASSHEVTYNITSGSEVDLNSVTITGTLIAETAAGDYVLKVSGDIGGSGNFNIGSDGTPYPSTCTFTIDFDSTGSSIEGGSGLTCNFYCLNPTNQEIQLSVTEAAGQTELSVDTDVTGDIWKAGDQVCICNVNKTQDPELRTIAVGGISSDHIDVTVGLSTQKLEDSCIVLVTRNIKITNTTDYAFRSIAGSVLGCEISGCTNGIFTGSNNTISGAIYNCGNGIASSYSNTITAAISSGTYFLNSSYDNTVSGVIAGVGSGLFGSYNNTVSSMVCGCNRGVESGRNNVISGTISGCGHGLYTSHNNVVSGTISNCSYGISYSDHNIITNEVSNCTYGLFGSYGNTLYGVDMTGLASENPGYGDTQNPPWSYSPSYDHDAVSGAFKAWTRGGVVLSQTASPPDGYTTYYEHACEDANNYCFRQVVISLDPGQTIRVASVMQIADGEDLSSDAPTVEIIDPAADPLWGTGESALATATIPTSDGSVTSWQVMSTISYENTGSIPKDVIVRAKVKHATADVNEVWSFDFDYPSVDDVRSGTSYGFDEVGVLGLPSESDVKSGVAYGANGTEYIGIFEQNVKDMPDNVINDGISTGKNIIGR